MHIFVILFNVLAFLFTGWLILHFVIPFLFTVVYLPCALLYHGTAAILRKLQGVKS